MTVKDIENTIKDASKMKHEVTVRDISYVILFFEYCNSVVAYKSIFDKDADEDSIRKYDTSKKIDFLKMYIASNQKKKDEDKSKESLVVSKIEADISKEENKAAIIALIDEIKQAENDGLIDKKDSLKMQADLRNKLDNKLDSGNEDIMQFIIVNQKFNSICEYCGREISVPTKEDLMKKYNLVEKDNE